jgi:hypothetical protein
MLRICPEHQKNPGWPDIAATPLLPESLNQIFIPRNRGFLEVAYSQFSIPTPFQIRCGSDDETGCAEW